MTPQEVFKYKFEQSRQILSGMDQMRLLDLSAYLRHMLLEGLMDRVNKDFRIDIKFRLTPTDGDFVFGFDIRVNDKSVVSYSNHAMLNLSKVEEWVACSRFLACPVVMTQGHVFTVKEIIRLCANNMGGVHLNREFSDDERMRALVDLEAHTQIGNVRGAWQVLATIGKITINALNPLYSRVCWG